MWPELVKELADFSSAVVTGIDGSGYPISIRCKPEPDADAQVLRVQIPEYAQIQPGPASLLCHKHDERLWNLKSFTVCGSLEQNARGWSFRPQKFIPGAGIGGMWAMVKFVQSGRRSTQQYLDKRHLVRPKIEWDTLHAIWEDVKRAE